MTTSEWIQLLFAVLPSVAIGGGMYATSKRNDHRLDKLVEVSANHENRLTRLEAFQEYERAS